MPDYRRPKDLPHGGFEWFRMVNGRHGWRLWDSHRATRQLAHSGPDGFARRSDMYRDAQRFVRLVEEVGAIQLGVCALGPPIPKRSMALDAPAGVQ